MRFPKLGLGVTALALAFDQAVKWLVTGPLGLDYDYAQTKLLPIFNLTFSRNAGISLGLLTANSPLGRWALVAMTVAIASGVIWWMVKERNREDSIALGLILGGALGNILDRVRLGYVVDYADLHFGEFRPFLIFNAADAVITIGVLILLGRALLVREKAGQDSVENANA